MKRGSFLSSLLAIPFLPALIKPLKQVFVASDVHVGAHTVDYFMRANEKMVRHIMRLYFNNTAAYKLYWSGDVIDVHPIRQDEWYAK